MGFEFAKCLAKTLNTSLVIGLRVHWKQSVPANQIGQYEPVSREDGDIRIGDRKDIVPDNIRGNPVRVSGGDQIGKRLPTICPLGELRIGLGKRRRAGRNYLRPGKVELIPEVVQKQNGTANRRIVCVAIVGIINPIGTAPLSQRGTEANPLSCAG